MKRKWMSPAQNVQAQQLQLVQIQVQFVHTYVQVHVHVRVQCHETQTLRSAEHYTRMRLKNMNRREWINGSGWKYA